MADRHTRPLQELRGADTSVYGGKSASLGELIAGAIPVPPGFAVSTTAFRSFLEQAGLRPGIDSAMARVSVGDAESVATASHAISESMRSAAMPEEARTEIAACYRELASGAGETEPPVAVRSSAIGEDSAEATFAGQQETY